MNDGYIPILNENKDFLDLIFWRVILDEKKSNSTAMLIFFILILHKIPTL